MIRSRVVSEIFRFPGVVVAMLYNDHTPPHFHVRYGDQRATIGIDPPVLLAGRLSPRVLGLVVEWSAMRRDELVADWERARAQQPLLPVPPLE